MHPGYPWTTIYLWVKQQEPDVLVVPTKQESGYFLAESADASSSALPIPGMSARVSANYTAPVTWTD